MFGLASGVRGVRVGLEGAVGSGVRGVRVGVEECGVSWGNRLVNFVTDFTPLFE